MKFPKELKIGYRPYSIKYDEDIKNVFGFCDINKAEITIGEHEDPASLANTILHEALHAIYFESGLKQREKIRKPKREEDIVRSIADSLSHLFIQNPEETVWILQQLGLPVTMKRKHKDA